MPDLVRTVEGTAELRVSPVVRPAVAPSTFGTCLVRRLGVCCQAVCRRLLVGLVAHGEWVSSSQRRSGSADWVAQAGCRDRDPDEFTGEDITESALQAARAVCWGCPVMRQCAGYAREIEATWGLWAGHLRTPRSPGRGHRVA